MRKAILTMLALGVALGALLIEWEGIPRFGSVALVPPIARDTTSTVPRVLPQQPKEVEKRVIAPPPLRAAVEAPLSLLTQEGTFAATNREREAQGLPLLLPSVPLNAAAELKVQDMFAKQYFTHVSPEGVGAADLAERVGYRYLLIGENLALGNFENDEALVAAWLKSPGHRANIVNPRYLEIGIAVGRGIFEGKTTYLAVQTFGTPASVCADPDVTLRATIASKESELDAREVELAALRADIDAMQPQRREEREEYNAKVEAYNALAEQFNVFLLTTKGLIATYNAEVVAFNLCLERYAASG